MLDYIVGSVVGSPSMVPELVPLLVSLIDPYLVPLLAAQLAPMTSLHHRCWERRQHGRQHHGDGTRAPLCATWNVGWTAPNGIIYAWSRSGVLHNPCYLPIFKHVIDNLRLLDFAAIIPALVGIGVQCSNKGQSGPPCGTSRPRILAWYWPSLHIRIHCHVIDCNPHHC